MKGSIIGFDPDTGTGAIQGEDGSRYDFVRLDWHGADAPRRGVAVDFVAAGAQARDVYPSLADVDLSEGDTAKIVYVLYLFSLAVGVTAIVGLIVAYVNRGDAPEWVRSHYRFQIRTFWIGLLYAVVSLVTAIVFFGFLIAMFTLVWWIVRSVKGLKLLTQGMPYDKPASWFW